jgi:hypothetical protein
MFILGFVMLVMLLLAGGSWAGYALYVGALDAHELGTKLRTPHPASACDWPELCVDSVVVDPEAADRVVLVARWPAHAAQRSILVLEMNPPAARRLARWCDRTTSVSPMRLSDGHLALRRRRSVESIDALLLAESPWIPETP